MTVEKLLLTEDGMDKLKSEIKHLKEDERPKVIAAIAEGRDYGDLKENAEYHSARERQSQIESKIAYLDELFAMAELIDPDKLSTDVIRIGNIATIVDLDDKSTKQFKVVSEYEANVQKRLISIKSPIGSVLLGKTLGDVISVQMPSGMREYEIIKIEK